RHARLPGDDGTPSDGTSEPLPAVRTRQGCKPGGTPTMTLESRLAKLERQAFLLRSTLVAGSFVLVVVATTGLVQQRGIEKVVRAEQFELRTTEGRRLGWWGVVGGSPTFALFGSNPTLPT